jgi:hypothetical protein
MDEMFSPLGAELVTAKEPDDAQFVASSVERLCVMNESSEMK